MRLLLILILSFLYVACLLITATRKSDNVEGVWLTVIYAIGFSAILVTLR